MKIKHAIATLGLAAVLGFGVGVGLKANTVKETKATVASGTIYRFSQNLGVEWEGGVYAYAYGGTGTAMDWPGVELGYSKNESSQNVYLFITSENYSHIIFHNFKNTDGKGKRATIELNGEDTAWYMDNNKGTWADGQLEYNYSPWPSIDDKTYYFYDYNDSCAGHAYAYAHMSGGDYSNVASEDDAVEMTKVPGTKQLYSITLDPMFDQIDFRKAGSGNDKIVANDIWVNGKNGKVYSTKAFDEQHYDINLNNAKADDWIFNYMHLRDIEHNTEDIDTGACKSTGNNYFNEAVAAYNAYDDSVCAIIKSYGDYFTKASERLSAWASACEKEVGFNEDGEDYTIVVNTPALALHTLPLGDNFNNDATLVTIIIVISSVSLIALGGFFFLKKRKESK